jgi:hypothetical protein
VSRGDAAGATSVMPAGGPQVPDYDRRMNIGIAAGSALALVESGYLVIWLSGYFHLVIEMCQSITR